MQESILPRISLQEMTVVKFTIGRALLECCICHLPLRGHKDGSHFYLCGAGHIFCDLCVRDHKESCGGSTSSNCCRVLEDITPSIYVKCACRAYVRYYMLKEHQGDCSRAKSIPNPIRRKCMVKAELLRCSTCGGPHRPPVFKPRSSDLLVCSKCHRADTGNKDYVRCPELEYLLKGIEIEKKIRHSYCTPIDEGETNRSLAGNNIAIGNTKGKAPPNVGRTDKHIADSNEDASDTEDESRSKHDFIDETDEEGEGECPNKLGTHKRVAETASKTPAYSKKQKIAMPSRQNRD